MVNKLVMTVSLKKHFKILAEFYSHSVDFDKDVMVISSSLNTIRISQLNKNETKVSYRLSSETKETIVRNADSYDVIIKLLTRSEEYLCSFGTDSMHTMTIENFIEEEMKSGSTIKDLKNLILKGSSEYVDLGGNRFEAVYYKGIIILTDDLLWTKFNVIDFELNEWL